MNTITLVLTREELNVIFTALAEGPYKVVNPVMQNIQMQLRAAEEEMMKKMPATAEEGEKK